MTDPGTIDILSTLALRGVLVAVADEARARAGAGFSATYRSTNASLALIAGGTRADMAILTREAMARLADEGIIAGGTIANLASSGVGIAVRAGAPRPDIGTVAAFRQAMLQAKSIAFSRQGASGIHFASVIAQLGIADEILRKATISDSYVGEIAARGEAEMAVQQISELKPVAGIDIVGPLPGPLQQISVFAAGIFAGAREAAAAGRLIAFLAEAARTPVLIDKGLEPPPRS